MGRALATAGHAVLFSGTTVMISLAGLFLVRTSNVRAMAVPALGLRYGVDTGAGAVQDSPAGRGLAAISASFASGMVAPISVVVSSGGPDRLSDLQLEAIAAFTARVSGDPRVAGVSSVTTLLDQRFAGHSADRLELALTQLPQAMRGVVSADAATAVVTVYPANPADTDQTQALVTSLRGDAAAVARQAGLAAHVGGSPAALADITAENARATPLVIGAVTVGCLAPGPG